MDTEVTFLVVPTEDDTFAVVRRVTSRKGPRRRWVAKCPTEGFANLIARLLTENYREFADEDTLVHEPELAVIN